MFKVNNKNTSFISIFEHIAHLFLVFLLMNLNKQTASWVIFGKIIPCDNAGSSNVQMTSLNM